nr:adenosine kinase [Candidatus Delongbacteria bacterium]
MEKRVLGIGNALVDVLSYVSDDLIDEIQYPKGSMQLVNWKEISRIISRLSDINRSTGGSASK